MYSDLTVNNKSFLKRFSHGRRFQIAIDLLCPSRGDRILDYGTGDGYMLKAICQQSNECVVVGYEPVPQMYKELTRRMRNKNDGNQINIVSKLDGSKNQFNKICCLEVLEHLTEENQKRELLIMKNALVDTGLIIISVPIEVGMSSFAKNMARLLLGQTHTNTTILTVIKSTLGMKIDRGNSQYISTHIGFNYHDLEKLMISQGLRIKNRIFSPIKLLKGIINSQVFYVLEKES